MQVMGTDCSSKHEPHLLPATACCSGWSLYMSPHLIKIMLFDEHGKHTDYSITSHYQDVEIVFMTD